VKEGRVINQQLHYLKCCVI